ncbi:MAG: carbohydrate kinase family protein [Beutenbergiaceae bacterium]
MNTQAPKPEIICIGMSVVDVLVRGFQAPAPNSTEFVDEVRIHGGGDAYNQAIALGHLGHRVALATRTGDDAPGQILHTECAAAGVDTSLTTITSEIPTITSIALVGADAERGFLTQRALAAHFPVSDNLAATIAAGPRILSVGSLCWSDGFDLEVLPDLLATAQRAGSYTVADFTTDRDVPLASLTPLLTHLDCILPSLTEAAHLTGETEAEAIAAAFRANGAHDVVIKLGAQGAVGFFGNDTIHVQPWRVSPVDTTGAGDNFVAGFVSGQLSGLDVPQSLRFGAATAAMATTKIGGSGALKSRAHVEDFIDAHSQAS